MKTTRLETSLLVLLLLWRIGLLGFGRQITDPNNPYFIELTYIVGTYLLSGAFIYIRRADLSSIHITYPALIVFAISPLLVPLAHLAADTPFFIPPYRWDWDLFIFWPQVLLSVFFCVILILKRKSFVAKWDSYRAILLALVIGTAIGIAYEYIGKYPVLYESLAVRYSFSFPAVLTMVITQIGLPGVNEEPLFRGILWGWLKERRFPEVSILFIQAFLFSIAHIYHLPENPAFFWIIVPTAGIIFGLFAWRTRSIMTSMIVHGLVNAMIWLIPHYINLP